jgi:hypothetical protein
MPASPHIGTQTESSLHAALKEWYCEPGDQVEVPVDGYVIDILRGAQLVEIQRRNFSAIKSKLRDLLKRHPLRLIHPIAREKWIVRQSAGGRAISRRKSPKRGRPEDVFFELVRIPGLAGHPNFSLELVMIQEQEVWQDDGLGSWRRKGWSIKDSLLLAVVSQKLFRSLADYTALLPDTLPDPFTTSELSEALACRMKLAQKMAYTLKGMGVLRIMGKRGRYLLYSRT